MRPTFRERAIFATRQLAKRQTTWLRSELDARWFDPDDGGKRNASGRGRGCVSGLKCRQFVNPWSTAFYLPEQIVKMSWLET